MLSISFPGHPKARAIIIDGSVNGVSGIVECDICDWHAVLLESETEKLSDEIEKFIKEHDCGMLAREKDAIAIKAMLYLRRSLNKRARNVKGE